MHWRSLAIHLLIGVLATIVAAWVCVLTDPLKLSPPPPPSPGRQFTLPEVRIREPKTDGQLVKRMSWMNPGPDASLAAEEISAGGSTRLHSQTFDFSIAGDAFGVTVNVDNVDLGWPLRGMQYSEIFGGRVLIVTGEDDPEVIQKLLPIQKAGALRRPLSIHSDLFKLIDRGADQSFPLMPIFFPFLGNTLIFAATSVVLTAAVVRAKWFASWFAGTRHGVCCGCGYDARGLHACPECSRPARQSAAAQPVTSVS